MVAATETIGERLQRSFDELTRAERQLANSILENYPVSGLGSITTVASNAAVSTPTVVRMVRKLGFAGFPQFQAELRRELEAKGIDVRLGVQVTGASPDAVTLSSGERIKARTLVWAAAGTTSTPGAVMTC